MVLTKKEHLIFRGIIPSPNDQLMVNLYTNRVRGDATEGFLDCDLHVTPLVLIFHG